MFASFSTDLLMKANRSAARQKQRRWLDGLLTLSLGASIDVDGTRCAFSRLPKQACMHGRITAVTCAAL